MSGIVYGFHVCVQRNQAGRCAPSLYSLSTLQTVVGLTPLGYLFASGVITAQCAVMSQVGLSDGQWPQPARCDVALHDDPTAGVLHEYTAVMYMHV